jgi:hypothetical protein
MSEESESESEFVICDHCNISINMEKEGYYILDLLTFQSPIYIS